jgi:hypothetical protein
MACAALLLAGVPGVAGADTGRPAADTGGTAAGKPGGPTTPTTEKPVTTVRQIVPSTEDLPSPRQSAGGTEPSAAGLASARQRIMERDGRRARGEQAPDGPRIAETPLLSPDLNVVDCQQEPFSYLTGGFVIDHYRYCEVTFWEVKTTVCAWRTLLGCLRSREIAHAEFRMSTAGYGYDWTRYRAGDWVDRNLNQAYWITLLDDWRNVRGEAPIQPLTVETICDAKTGAPCLADNLAGSVTKTIAQWEADGGTFMRWLERPIDGLGPDNLAYFDFHTRFTYGAPPGQAVGNTRGNGYRCDYALYLRGGQGCMFHRVESLFAELNLRGDTNYRKAATHIFDALYRPEVTKPEVAGKSVPGSPFTDNPRPLNRVYDVYDPLLVRDNNAEAVRTCREWWGPDYAQGGQFDCDEFPFASTLQGASRANGNYSARVIDASDNRSAGAILRNWYNRERILHGDPFFVVLTFGTGGGGGGGGEIPDRAPVVNAGPDTSGDEGSSIVLGGSAFDAEGPPSSSWTYSAGADVDPGATCTFGDPGAPATMFTCTDDGTFTVTLTARDGVNSPVSDSAVVHVHNVAPELALAAQTPAAAGAEQVATAAAEPGPQPWSVYRVGDPVTLTAPFHDPGSNDTQTCVVDWDDGGEKDTYPATASGCDRTHTYPHAGMYTIRLTVTDDDTGADNSVTLVVVYDPDGGFATGGGFLDSPAGALTSRPDATGKLHVRLNPKYHSRDTGPAPSSGRVAVSSTEVGFRLDSTALEWLVVTPDGKVAVKGTGTVDGQDGFGFVAYGFDEPDAFRLLVWPLSTGDIPGEATVYDNRPGGDYDVDLADPQDLAGGSINVHH